MRTLKQIEASRANGRLSKGPKTAAGKAISSQNAKSFAWLLEDTLLPGESSTEFANFSAGLSASFNPADEIEQRIVQQMVWAAWKARRFPAAEAGFINAGCRQLMDEGFPYPEYVVGELWHRKGRVFTKLARYESRLQRQFHNGYEDLEHMQNKKCRNEPKEVLTTLLSTRA